MEKQKSIDELAEEKRARLLEETLTVIKSLNRYQILTGYAHEFELWGKSYFGPNHPPDPPPPPPPGGQ